MVRMGWAVAILFTTTGIICAHLHHANAQLTPKEKVHAILQHYDVSKSLHSEQCRNYFGHTGVTREVVTLCEKPIAHNATRLTRDMVAGGPDQDSPSSWIGDCFRAFPERFKRTHIVSSSERKFIYVDVVKSGSASIRKMLLNQGHGLAWVNGATNPTDRTYSNSINPTDHHSFFIFSMVRDPIARMLSSFQQAVHADVCSAVGASEDSLRKSAAAQQKCFDWCVIKLLEGKQVNEHFQTQALRLLTTDSEENLLNYGFVGKLEQHQHYWTSLFQQIFQGHNRTRYGSKSLPHTVHQGIDIHIEVLPWHVLALCAIYAQDFVCFNYTLPTLCKGQSGL
eukprot:m.26470 g.26470  ORF g.26470 m.26470 type:complete len:338 (-) comp15415_c0_seq1:287-1300(-)